MKARQGIFAGGLPQRPLSLVGMAGICILIAVFLALYLGNSARSYVVQADILSARIEFLGSTSKPWQISTLILCQRRADRVSASAALPVEGSVSCNPALYDVHQLENQIIEWPDGVAIRIRHLGESNGVEIHVQRYAQISANDGPFMRIGEHPVGEQDILVIPDTAWAREGSLIFSGYLTIGAEPISGVRDHLIAGKYEVRETLFLRSRPVLVMGGDFFTGDEVAILNAAQGGLETMTGFFQPSPDQNNSMRVVAYSSLGDGEMRINRLGAVPSIIRPAWMDRAINDPALLALTTLVVLVVIANGLLQIVDRLRILIGSPSKPL